MCIIAISLNSFNSNDWIRHKNIFSKPGFRTKEKFAKSGLFWTMCDSELSKCELESNSETKLSDKIDLLKFNQHNKLDQKHNKYRNIPTNVHLSTFKHHQIRPGKVFPYCDECHVGDAIRDSKGSMKIILWTRYNNIFSISMFIMLVISCYCSLISIFPYTNTKTRMKSSLVGALSLVVAGIANLLQLVVYISCEPMISKSKGDFRYGRALESMALVFLRDGFGRKYRIK